MRICRGFACGSTVQPSAGSMKEVSCHSSSLAVRRIARVAWVGWYVNMLFICCNASAIRVSRFKTFQNLVMQSSKRPIDDIINFLTLCIDASKEVVTQLLQRCKFSIPCKEMGS